MSPGSPRRQPADSGADAIVPRRRRVHVSALVLALAATVIAAPSVSAATITPVPPTDAGALLLAQAMVGDAATLDDAVFASVPPSGTPHGVVDDLSFFPTDGSSFAILTTGDVNLADEPNDSGSDGVALGGGSVRGDTDLDVTVLRLDLTTPAGTNCLRFDFAFYSEEFPEFVGSQFNDAFIAELDESTWTTSGSTITAPDNFAFDPDGNVISINSTGAASFSAESAAGTTYDGSTEVLSASTPIGPGEHALFLSIFDQGDQAYDSAVFVDDVRFGAVDDAAECETGADTPLPEFSIDDVSAPEGDSGTTDFTFTVSRSGDTTEASSVDYATTDGTATAPSDYTAIGDTTLGFAAGQTSRTVTVEVNGDTDVEPDETFFVDLSSPTNAVIEDARGRGTIVNDDDDGGGGESVLDIDDVSEVEGDKGLKDFDFTVSRSGDTSGSASVNYHTEEGTAKVPQDYVPIDDGLLTFAAGQTSATITIEVVGDGKRAPDETFTVVLSDPVGATIGEGTGTGTIINDDPFLAIRNASKKEPDSGFRIVRFKVRLSFPTVSDVVVHYRTMDGTATAGSDYKAKTNGTVTFKPGQWIKYARVRVLADGHHEPDENFFVELFDASGPDGDARIKRGTAKGTITD